MNSLLLLQSLTEDVMRQMEREKTLQSKYANLQDEVKTVNEMHTNTNHGLNV